MYSLTNQVCSLEQARELHELGVRCESLFYWFKDGKDQGIFTNEERIKYQKHYDSDTFIPAYTCSELGVMLPNICGSNRITFQLNIIKTDTGWLVWYDTCGYRSTIYETPEQKEEAQARASALIWLIKSGYIKAEEVKL